MASIDISAPRTFNANADSSKLCELWAKWMSGFKIYLIAANITDDARKRALLLHCGGSSLQDLFETLPSNSEATTYKQVCDLLTQHFTPKKNKRYERHIFRLCGQTSDENINQYVTKLRGMAKFCEFHDQSDEIVDQVIEKCHSNKLRKRLLKEADLTLDKLIETAQVIEATDLQIQQYDKNAGQVNYDSDDEVHKINSKKQLLKKYKREQSRLVEKMQNVDISDDEVNRIHNHSQFKFQKSKIASSRPERMQHYGTQKILQCYRCGSTSHLANRCTIACDTVCHACGKKGHLQRVCNSNHVKNENEKQHPQVSYIIASESDSDDDFCFSISDNSCENTVDIKLNGNNVKVMIDSGSNINVISKTLLDNVSPSAIIHPYNKNAFGFQSKQPLDILGKVSLNIELLNNPSANFAEFIIVPDECMPILGFKTSTVLNLLRIGPPSNIEVNTITNTNCSNDIQNQLNSMKINETKLNSTKTNENQ